MNEEDKETAGCFGMIVMILATIGSWVQFERWGLSGFLGAAAGMIVSIIVMTIMFSIGSGKQK